MIIRAWLSFFLFIFLSFFAKHMAIRAISFFDSFFSLLNRCYTFVYKIAIKLILKIETCKRPVYHIQIYYMYLDSDLNYIVT